MDKITTNLKISYGILKREIKKMKKMNVESSLINQAQQELKTHPYKVDRKKRIMKNFWRALIGIGLTTVAGGIVQIANSVYNHFTQSNETPPTVGEDQNE